MARDETKEAIRSKFEKIQGSKKDLVWMSGRQVTELLPKLNPSSVRMGLLFLYDDKVLLRERRKGRGGKGRTGQSAWYALNPDRGEITGEQTENETGEQTS